MKRTPLRQKRPTPRRNEGRIKHARIKVANEKLEKAHVERIARMPCIVPGCGAKSVIHHVMHMPHGMKRTRRDDRFIAPLCPNHHNIGNHSVHMLGSEAAFLIAHGIDLAIWAEYQWKQTEAGA